MARKKGHGGRRKGGQGQTRRLSGEHVKPANLPQGDALEVFLTAHNTFHEAVRPLECPVSIEFEKSGAKQASGGSKSKLTMDDWSKSEELLHWFKAGASNDSSASLVFSKTLGQGARAAIHRCAENIGLDSFSQGFGEDRHVTLYPKGQAPVKAVINDVTQKKAKLLHLLAKAENLRTSRDELTDMLAADSLPQNLQDIWDTKGAEQLGIVRLNKAASRGETDELQAAIKDLPELVKSGKAEVASNLTPLNCAAAKGYVACLQMLLDAGAPLEAQDGFGLTPLQASRKFEQMEVEGILLRAGADDLAGQSDLDRLSLPSSAEAPRPLRPSSAQVGSAKDRSAPKPSRFNLQQAIHAKPFVPKTSASQQALGSQENLANGVGQEAGGSRRPSNDSGGSGKGLNVDAEPFNRPLSKMGNHTPARSSFENVQGAAIRETSEQVGEALPTGPAGNQDSRTATPLGKARTLSSQLPDGLRREYGIGSPNLKDDPRVATRGRPGASAVALGRRIMESANPNLKRHSSLTPGDLGPQEDNGETQLSARAISGRLAQTQGYDPISQRLNSDKMQMTFSRRQEPTWKDNRHRVNEWMESAPEEHSSQTLPLTQSYPDLRNQRTSLDSRPDSAPAETSAQTDAAEPDSPDETPLKGRRLSTLRESDDPSHTRELSNGQISPKEGAFGERAAADTASSGEDVDELSSAANMHKARGGEEEALDKSWQTTRKIVEEAAQSPESAEELSFTEIVVPQTEVDASQPQQSENRAETENPEPAGIQQPEDDNRDPSSREGVPKTPARQEENNSEDSQQKLEEPASDTSQASKGGVDNAEKQPDKQDAVDKDTVDTRAGKGVADTGAADLPEGRPDSTAEEHVETTEPESQRRDEAKDLVAAKREPREEPDSDKAASTDSEKGGKPSSPTEETKSEPIAETKREEAKNSPSSSSTGKRDLPGPKIQDPRGAAFPSAPPQASGAAAPIERLDVPITYGSLPQASQPANIRPEDTVTDLQAGKANASEVGKEAPLLNGSGSKSDTSGSPAAAARAPYLEGTQPPRLSANTLDKVPAVVGGRSLSGNLDAEGEVGEAIASLDPRQATYGQKGPSATGVGKRVMSDAAQGLTPEPSTALPGAQEAPKYVEPSQPPEGTQHPISGIPTVVGGKAVKKDPEDEPDAEPAKRLSGESSRSAGGDVKEGVSNKGLSLQGDQADEQGEALSALSPSPGQSAESAAKQDMGTISSPGLRNPPAMARISEEPATGSQPGSASPSVESPPDKPKPSLESVPEGKPDTSESAEGRQPGNTADRARELSSKGVGEPGGRSSLTHDTVCNLLGSSSTAEAMKGPRGMGKSQGLPSKKRPSSAKTSARNVKMKEGSAKVPKSKSSQAAANRSVGERSDTVSEDQDGEKGHSALNLWIEEHKYILYGAVATGAAAVAALFWAVRR